MTKYKIFINNYLEYYDKIKTLNYKNYIKNFYYKYCIITIKYINFN